MDGSVPLGLVEHVAFSGQMHGVILWRKEALDLGKFEEDGNRHTSKLITWEDKRCDARFLDSIQKPESGLRVSAGTDYRSGI